MAFPIWAAIGGGLKLLSSFGGMFGNHSSGMSIEDAVISNALQKDLFDYQFSKQLEAMNSAHQREVKDLRAAGLNPILSASGGSGLSSPTSGMPDISGVNSAVVQSKQAERQMKVNAMLGAVDRALQFQSNQIADKNADIQAKNAESERMNAITNQERLGQTALSTWADSLLKVSQSDNLSYQNKKLLSDIGVNASLLGVNSALANKYRTDAYVANEMLPWQKYQAGTSGSVAGTLSYPIKEVIDKLTNWKEKNSSSAKEKNLDWLKNKGLGFGFLGK